MSNASHVLFSLGCQIDLRTSKATSSTVQYFIARVDYCFSGSHKSQVTFPLPLLLVPPRPHRREILSPRNHRHGRRDAFLHAAPSLLAAGARPLPPYLIRSPSHLSATTVPAARQWRRRLDDGRSALCPSSPDPALESPDPALGDGGGGSKAAVARRRRQQLRLRDGLNDGGGSSAA